MSGTVNDVDEQVCDYESSYVFVGAVHGVLLRSDSSADDENDSILSRSGVQTYVGQAAFGAR